LIIKKEKYCTYNWAYGIIQTNGSMGPIKLLMGLESPRKRWAGKHLFRCCQNRTHCTFYGAAEIHFSPVSNRQK